MVYSRQYFVSITDHDHDLMEMKARKGLISWKDKHIAKIHVLQ